ncbi:Subtilisin Carlsberg [Colletotrichum orbiculare MAFF 240422]|uniref:Subtilisin Carlsberg n=1 Tax=Colletotrichum orbiculare (strain 104-T / ATCC 96160 / CBS 514.97 / LARS 414 / MAFF 240422) TaxID=1213857 RepID=A0A484FEK2_COLOR|nr:Subtilisin Carlsberg [Colletotrichum orbiculare MAFF 240422]
MVANEALEKASECLLLHVSQFCGWPYPPPDTSPASVDQFFGPQSTTQLENALLRAVTDGYAIFDILTSVNEEYWQEVFIGVQLGKQSKVKFNTSNVDIDSKPSLVVVEESETDNEPRLSVEELETIEDGKYCQYLHEEDRIPEVVPVRVAILDTGLNSKLPFFCNEPSRLKKIVAYEDFVGGTTDLKHMIDTNGHGSFMARLLMEVAPHAEVYVARVAADSKSLSKSSRNIVKAIEWAAIRHNVDIISMSFGMESDDLDIREAIGHNLPSNFWV